MIAEIVSNGDEIVCGKILDTNAQWLSRELESIGISTLYHTSVSDDLAAMVDVLRIAMRRTDLIIWTGGLGPTDDDLTRRAFADAVGVPLVEDEQSLQHVQSVFQRRGTAMPPNFRSQVYQPQGAVPIYNPHGTAPGIDMTVQRTAAGRLGFVRMLAFPGVPAELYEMWEHSGRQSLLTLLDTLRGEKRVIKQRSIHSFGLGESQVEAMLPGIVARDHIPRVGITATQGTITLRIVAEALTEIECEQLMEPTARLIYETLDTRIFGEGDDTLPDVVCRMITSQKKKIAVVEAGTRGLLAESLANSKESAECFLGGVVVPPRQSITPEKMVALGRKMFDADYFLLAGAYPEGLPERFRTDEVFVGVAAAEVQIRKFSFSGHPGIIDDLYVKRALDLFRLSVEMVV